MFSDDIVVGIAGLSTLKMIELFTLNRWILGCRNHISRKLLPLNLQSKAVSFLMREIQIKSCDRMGLLILSWCVQTYPSVTDGGETPAASFLLRPFFLSPIVCTLLSLMLRKRTRGHPLYQLGNVKDGSEDWTECVWLFPQSNQSDKPFPLRNGGVRRWGPLELCLRGFLLVER